MKRRTISARLFLFATVVALLVAPAVAAASVWIVEGAHQQTDLDRRLSSAAAFIGDHRAELGRGKQQALLQQRLTELRVNATLALIGQAGKTPIYVSAALLPAKRVGATKPREDPTLGPHIKRSYLIGTTKRTGVLLANVYYSAPDRTFRALVTLAAGGLALIIGLAGAAWLVDRWIVRPLRGLSVQVDAIAGGEAPVTATPSRVGEIKTVASALRSMASAFQEANDRNGRLQEDRRFFVTAIAHDLRTPTFSLRGYLQAMATGIGDRDVHLSRAQAKAAEVERLTSSLFAYARDEYLDEKPRLEIVQLGELIRTVVSDFEPAALAKEVTLRLEGPDDVVAVIDRERLERVLANLLDNALRHTPAGGTIDAAWGASEPSAWITVTDEGPGIGAAALPHLFDPSHQTNGMRNGRSGGAGLGLTIAKRLTESMGGEIEARNGPRAGAVFTVRLPGTPSEWEGTLA